MGTWSTDAFGNDDACDWSSDLKKTKDLSLVNVAIATVLEDGSDSLDASAAVAALAAMEVIARLRGHAGFSNAYTAIVDEWVQRTRLQPPAALVADALAALSKITGAQ